MFIPNTYEFYWTISEKKLLEKMYREYKKFWNPERMSRAAKLNLTHIEVSILASIVQEESSIVEEGPIIAGLYFNRIKKRYEVTS